MEAYSVPASEKLLLRLPEAAAKLSVGRSTLYELIDKGELPVVRIGRSVRLPTSTLIEWLKKKQSEHIQGVQKVNDEE